MNTQIPADSAGGQLAREKLSLLIVAGTICQDVFVTAGGSADEAVLGWISNVDLSRHATA